jgi:hypothetical protein
VWFKAYALNGGSQGHTWQIPVVQGTSTSRTPLIVRENRSMLTRPVVDWTRHLSLQHVDIRNFAAEEAVREGADPSRASSRAPTCQGGQGIKVDRRRRNELCSARTRTSARAHRPNPLEPFWTPRRGGLPQVSPSLRSADDPQGCFLKPPRVRPSYNNIRKPHAMLGSHLQD